ncbi:MAG: hypothetical protein ACI8S6_000978 [Myxococcota bacterium]|jgi:hypothetical protein
MWLWGLASALAWPLLGPDGEPTGREVSAEALFIEGGAPWKPAQIEADPAALAAVARDTLRYLRERAAADPLAVQPGVLSELGVTLQDVEETLAYIAHIAETTPEQLSDPGFWSREFTMYAWRPDLDAARERGLSLASDQIRVTRYLVYQLPGSSERTSAFPHALYAVPRDEAGLSIDEAEARAAELTRFRHTRPAVIGGVFEAGGDEEGGAEALVWLTRKGVYEAMMQGTIEVTLPDGQRRLYNVDRSNGMAYDPAVKDSNRQQRYWYFAQVEGVMGWGAERAHKVRLEPGVAVAGDVYNLGLGKLIAIERGGVARLAVLSDTGGAFQPNLFQLDLFTGAFPSREAFQAATWRAGGPSRAIILVRRRPHVPTVDAPQPTP